MLFRGFCLGASAVALCGAAPASIPQAVCNRAIAEVARTARTAGYMHGLVEARDASPSARDIYQELLIVEARSNRYEACLKDLSFASTRDSYYLKASVDECVKLLPYGH